MTGNSKYRRRAILAGLPTPNARSCGVSIAEVQLQQMPTGLKLCGPFVVFHGAVEVACFAEKISAFVGNRSVVGRQFRRTPISDQRVFYTPLTSKEIAKCDDRGRPVWGQRCTPREVH